jgi:diguanylate cyclase (GGDEF)-like protein
LHAGGKQALQQEAAVAEDAGIRPEQPKARLRSISLHMSLLRLVLACTLPGLVICAYLFYTNYHLEKDRIYRETELLAAQIGTELDRELARIESGLHVLATADSLRRGDFRRFHQIAGSALKSQIVYNYVLTDAKGRQILNTLRPYDAPLPISGTPEQLDEVFRTGKSVLTDLFSGPVTGQPSIAMGVPVFGKNNQVMYSLNASLAPERLNEMLRREALPEGWLAAIIDRAGNIVGRSRDAERFVGQKAVPALVERLKLEPHGVLEAQTKEGIPVVTAYSRSTLWNWSVATAAPKRLVEAGMFRVFLWLMLTVLLFVLVGSWLVNNLAKRVISSVEELNDAALALCDGKPLNLPSVQLKEAEAVGYAIMQASLLMAEVHHRAYHDPLTGLANRALFYELVQHQLAAAEREKRKLAVLAIDLDNFKVVNDAEGHATGDLLLKAVARRIEATIRAADVAARMGGDEFSVLLADTDDDNAKETARRLVAALAQPYAGVKTGVSASIGIAIYPHAGKDLGELLEHADRALYAVKRDGRNGFKMA